MGYYRTQGLADGFMQGFGLVDDYQNRQFQQDRQKAADVRAEESHDQNMASGKLELENAGLRLQKNQFDVDHMGEMHTARMGEIELGNKVKNAQLAREKFLQKKEQFEYDAKESLTLSDSILAAVNSGHSLNDDMITKVIESSKKPGSLFFAFGADLEKGKEINRVNTAFFNGEIPLSQALPSLQARFDPYVQELIGERDLKSGKEIVRAQVTDFNMTDQKNLKGTPMVTVTYADGTNATRPVTEHRLAGGDDKPIELGIDQIMQQQIADRQFLAYMAATGLDKKLKDGITALRTKAQPGKETPLQGDVRETFAGLMKQYNKAAAGKTDEMGSTYTPANPEEMAAITANIDRMAMQYPDMAKAYGWSMPTQADALAIVDQMEWPSAEERQAFVEAIGSGVPPRSVISDLQAYQQYTQGLKKQQPERTRIPSAGTTESYNAGDLVRGIIHQKNQSNQQTEQQLAAQPQRGIR